MPSLTVFLDASVILSGLASPDGGSGKVLEGGSKQKLSLITDEMGVRETERHLAKLGIKPEKLEALFIKKIVKVIPCPADAIIDKFQFLTSDPDDAHVLAGGVLSGADILLSLDKKHIVTPAVQKALSPKMVLTPQEFWGWIRKNQKKQ